MKGESAVGFGVCQGESETRSYSTIPGAESYELVFRVSLQHLHIACTWIEGTGRHMWPERGLKLNMTSFTHRPIR